MGITIEGEGMVFAKEHDNWASYTMGISSKTAEGNWINAYVPVRFRKGEKVDNKTKINFRAFPTVKENVVDGQNRNYIIWQILEWRIAGDDMSSGTPDANFTALQQDDIPF
jgi:hypothetical protein